MMTAGLFVCRTVTVTHCHWCPRLCGAVLAMRSLAPPRLVSWYGVCECGVAAMDAFVADVGFLIQAVCVL